MKTYHSSFSNTWAIGRSVCLLTIAFLFILNLTATAQATNFPALKGAGLVRGSGSLTGVKTNPKLLPTPTISRYSKPAVHVGEELYVYGKFLSSSPSGLKAYLHNNTSSWNIPISNWSPQGTGFNTRVTHADAGRYEVNIISNGKMVAHGPMTLTVLPGSR